MQLTIVVSNYSYVGGIANSSLVFSCWVSGPNRQGATSASLVNQYIDLNRGYISLSSSALLKGDTLDVSSSLNQGELQIVFPTFSSNSTIEYGSILGIDYNPIPLGIIIGLSISCGVIIILIILALFVYFRRRRRGYTQV
jgi:hypothetical protein